GPWLSGTGDAGGPLRNVVSGHSQCGGRSASSQSSPSPPERSPQPRSVSSAVCSGRTTKSSSRSTGRSSSPGVPCMPGSLTSGTAGAVGRPDAGHREGAPGGQVGGAAQTGQPERREWAAGAYSGPPPTTPPPPGWRPPVHVQVPPPRRLPPQDMAAMDQAEQQ